MFLSKVKCTSDHLIGQVIGRGGSQIRKLEQYVPNTVRL
jgi:hypothetical protein